MKTFIKYYLKEYFFYTFIFFAVFSVLITLVQGILKLQKFIELAPSFHEIIHFFVLMYFELVSFSLPLAGFMGILFAIHRMKEDKELLGFLSLGFSFSDLFKPLFLFAVILWWITFIFHFWVLPVSKKSLKIMKYELLKKQMIRPFPAKTPVPITSKDVLYLQKDQKKDGIHQLKKVFLYQQGRDKVYLFIADSAKIDVNARRIILYRGWGFSSSNGVKEVFKFGEYGFFLPIQNLPSKPSFSRGEHTFSELRQAISKMKKGTKDYYSYLTEYWGRFFYPLSVLFLSIQAFFMGIKVRTSHRFALFFSGIGVYLSFYILFDTTASFAKNGKFKPFLSFFSFYAVVLIFLIFEGILFLKKKREVFL
ncbi:MAG: YjgP/YjgQ family permease [Thermodesulfobacteria bacterium]|nr:YjgP/YjgQ family permease [Thermodesulfobacteriota bacterium]